MTNTLTLKRTTIENSKAPSIVLNAQQWDVIFNLSIRGVYTKFQITIMYRLYVPQTAGLAGLGMGESQTKIGGQGIWTVNLLHSNDVVIDRRGSNACECIGLSGACACVCVFDFHTYEYT